MASKEEHKTIENLIDISVSSLNDLVDVNTVIGKPFLTASGVQIIPFTKVTVGYLSGGGEYGETKVMQADGKSFAGGAGSVVSLKPCGFLIEDGKGCRLLKVTDEPLENLMEKAESLLSRYAPAKKAE
jgi:sporulation protein YtfJ